MPETLLKIKREHNQSMEGHYINRFELNGNPVDVRHIAAEELNAVKKPIMLQVFRIDIPFEVETIEGEMKSMPEGGYLIIGVRGEGYACNKEIFRETYNVFKQIS